MKRITFVLKPGPEGEAFLAELSAYTRKVDGTVAVSVGLIQSDGRVLVSDAARGMTTRFDPESYATFGKHPGCAGVQVDPVPPSSPPQRKYGNRS